MSALVPALVCDACAAAQGQGARLRRAASFEASVTRLVSDAQADEERRSRGGKRCRAKKASNGSLQLGF